MYQLAEVITEMLNERTANQVRIIKASVVSAPPDLTIKFGEEVIPSNQIYCSNYLLPHYHRNYTIEGVIDKITVQANNSTATAPAGPGPHTHNVPTLDFTGSGTYKSHQDIWFEDTLKTGDEVLVVVLGIFYVVVTKITKMPSGAIEGV